MAGVALPVSSLPRFAAPQVDPASMMYLATSLPTASLPNVQSALIQGASFLLLGSASDYRLAALVGSDPVRDRLLIEKANWRVSGTAVLSGTTTTGVGSTARVQDIQNFVVDLDGEKLRGSFTYRVEFPGTAFGIPCGGRDLLIQEHEFSDLTRVSR